MTDKTHSSANANQTVSSGVYVVRSGQTVFYVPAEWLTWLSGERVLGSLDPPIEKGEAADRLHELRPGPGLELKLRIPGREAITAPDFPVHSLLIITQERRGSPLPGSSASLRQPDALGWSQVGQGSGFVDVNDPSVSVNSPHQADLANGHSEASTFPNSSSYFFKGTNVVYRWQEADAPQGQWRDLRKRVARLIEWLETPPSERSASPAV